MEKPFGTDLASAVALNDMLHSVFDEDQIFRIDHFLGKEAAQNILAFRFANGLFEPIWNRDHIDHVQIDVPETLGVDDRVAFYEATGAFKDMVVTHLFQILGFMAMEPPTALAAGPINEEKNKVFRSMQLLDVNEVVRGQYEGYRDIPGVAPDSDTETFVALKVEIDNWRWAGVPFYLRTGKAMSVRDTEVVIQFKPVPFVQFAATKIANMPANKMVIQIQPDEGLRMELLIKKPGLAVDAASITLNFNYADRFDVAHLVGYESLLYDLFTGDQTLFQRADGIEAGWAAVQPFLELWKAGKPEPYPAGSLGPAAADALLKRDGHAWHSLTLERQ